MYKCKTLKNGLTIVGEEIPYLKSVSLGIWINTGSRIETPKESGVSHFIEHMLFKGTKNRSAKDIARDIDNIGGQINAFTNKECTCYYVHLLDEHINIGIDVLSDMILNSTFNNNDIDRERAVILEELKMYEDSLDDLSYDLLVENIYADDGLGMNILGNRQTIKSLKRKDILNHYNKYYVPNNAVISICGNFNFEEVVKLIEERFSEWEEKEVDIEVKEAKFHSCFITRNKDSEQVNIAINLKAIPEENEKEAYALAVINNIFGGSTSSRLFQNIREDKGLVYSIYSSQTLYKKCGELGIFASTSEEYLKEVYNLIIKEIKNIKENYVTEEELKESKEQLKGNYILSLESISSKMLSHGESMLLNNKIKNEDEIIEHINSVNMEQVEAVINKVFNIENLGVCIVGKNVEGVQI
ncbi:M16 family metallopeptidase [Terrisporobacter mayombei]|uniref:Zinc protease n=1 Tax=Terrisporobacter mayombei TaxID=1541 RepID=A0ABY9Q0D0_9FIRM|nr:pitrilysin family protein [Terrisporobacter mayombei]MCC3867147.1 insulinase family protein [Terrisporobacter mayombei]WMT81408.1 putative zinc protease [Terrisporobacter mayombei]